MIVNKNNQPGGSTMRKVTIYFALILTVLSLIALTSTGNVSAATAASGNVYYNLPYLHTHANNVVYCVVANFTTDNITTASFTVKASGGSTPNTTAISLASASFGGNSSNMITFTGQYIYVGTTQAADLSTALGLSSSTTGGDNTTSDNTTTSGSGSDNTTGSGKGEHDKSYSANKDGSSSSGGKNTKIPYGGTLTFSGGSIDCQKIAVSCFQGTTNPKRPIGGYTCVDDSTTGPSGGKNVLSF
jgi:hypothetical protein